MNDREIGRRSFVLYWMQQSQRATFNHALEYAIREANARDLPMVVGFGLIDDYPEANLRHYAFMLQGLKEVERTLAERRIKLVVRRGPPDRIALALAEDAALVVCDRGYLCHQKAWRATVAREAPCRVVQVESDVVVPVEAASDKHESAARTLRPKLRRIWDKYLRGLVEHAPRNDSRHLSVAGDVDLSDLKAVLADLNLDREVPPVRRFKGGTSEAQHRLSRFLRDKLKGYADSRSEPAAYQCSMLSPYLHFGQISPVAIALKARESKAGTRDDRAAFLEELIVRRELSMNFVNFNPVYDAYESLPAWARTTLAKRADDRREHIYSRKQLEAADTHDAYWNAAMREMVHTGYMHNYMRMYWAKKILEWSGTPVDAFKAVLYLNNKYFLDGRDANSYANVAWVFGLHDRAWTERPVFGKVRYMNANGLKRKFDMKAYMRVVQDLVAAERSDA